MAVKNFYGAEHNIFSSSVFIEEIGQTNCSIASTPAYTGLYSYRVNTSTTGAFFFSAHSADGTTSSSGHALSNFWIEFRFRFATKSSAATGEQILDIRTASSTSKGSVRLRSDGTLAVYDSTNSLVATGSTALQANTWYLIGYRGSTNASASAYELRINNVTELSGSMSQSNTVMSGPRLGRFTNINSTATDYFYDDVVVDDAQFNGGLRVGLIHPGAETVQEWTAGTAPSDYTLVGANSLSVFSYTRTTGVANETSTYCPTYIDTCNIKSVKLWALVAEDSGTPTSGVKLQFQSGATLDETTAANVTTALTSLAKVYNTDPNTSQPWYYWNVNQLRFGVKETTTTLVRNYVCVLSYLYSDYDSGIILGPAGMVAQETGTPYPDNPYVESAFSPTPIPPSVNDTRPFRAFAADLGFSWDDNEGGVLIAFGDTFSEGWMGPDVAVGSTGNATVSTGFDATNMQGRVGDNIVTSSSAYPNSPNNICIIRASDSRRLYFRYQSRSGSTLQQCKFVASSSAGSTTVSAGDVIERKTLHRGSTLARSTDFNLSNGYSIDNFRPAINGDAQEVVPNTSSGGSGNDMYSAAPDLSVTSLSITSHTVKIVFSNPHGITRRGQLLKIKGASPARLNTEYIVVAIPNPKTVLAFNFVEDDITATGTILAEVATFQYTTDPTVAAEATRIPSGGVAVPGVGVGGATRQYMFYWSVNRWPGGDAIGSALSLTAFMGIAYSDDVGLTWTDASYAGKVSSSVADVTTFNGSQTLVCTNVTDLPSTGGVVEVDTSNGYAYLSYGSRTSNTLNSVNYVSGSGTLLGSSSGVRYALWGNNASYGSKQQQAWPWRSGGYIYCLTTPCNRFGPAYMMRVAENSVLNISAWRYWDGTLWSADKDAAIPIFGTEYFTGYVAEPSFMYHEGLEKWLASYWDEGSSQMVVRTADNPEGPWSSAVQVMTSNQFNTGAYGAFIHPKSGVAPNAPEDLYFHVSLWSPYATFLMKATLGPRTVSAANVEGLARAGVSSYTVLQAVRPTGISSGETFGTNVVVSSTFFQSVSGIDSTLQFGTPTLTSEYDLSATGLVSSNLVGEPTIQGSIDANIAGLPETSGIGEAQVLSNYPIAPSSITNVNEFGVSITTALLYELLLTGFDSGSEVGWVRLGMDGETLVDGIGSTIDFGVAIFTTSKEFSVSGFDSNTAVGSPSVSSNFTISVSGISSTVELGSISYVLAYLINVIGLGNLNTFGSPFVGEDVAPREVDITGLFNSPTFGIPHISGGISYYDQIHSVSFTIKDATTMSVNVSLRNGQTLSAEISSDQFTNE